MRPRHSVNEGSGKDFYRKGNSVKRFRPFSESLDSAREDRMGGFRKGGFSNNRFVLKPDVAIASEVSILSKNSLAITDFHAKKTQQRQHIQLFESPLPGTPHSRFPVYELKFSALIPFPNLRSYLAGVPRQAPLGALSYKNSRFVWLVGRGSKISS